MNKTKPTAASVDDYLLARGSETQREDCRRLIALLQEVTGHPPTMWGPSIIGFGSYRYTYESGRSGEAPLAGFAIRGRDLVLYFFPELPGLATLLSDLGTHSVGKSCLYFKRLDDLHRPALEELVTRSMTEVLQRWPQPSGGEDRGEDDRTRGRS